MSPSIVSSSFNSCCFFSADDGELFMDGCNICTCFSGELICTKKHCPEPVFSPEYNASKCSLHRNFCLSLECQLALNPMRYLPLVLEHRCSMLTNVDRVRITPGFCAIKSYSISRSIYSETNFCLQSELKRIFLACVRPTQA